MIEPAGTVIPARANTVGRKRPLHGDVPHVPSGTVAARGPARNKEYGDLKQLIAGRGLLVKDPSGYLPNAIVLIALLVVIVAGMAVGGPTTMQLLWAVPAAFLFGQMAFIGHDSAHLQVFQSSRHNYILSVLIFNLGLGGSRGWWTDRHNRHHASPNDVVADPDFSSDVLAYVPEQTTGLRGFPRYMVRHQANFIGGLLLLQTINSRIHSARFLSSRRLRNSAIEIGLVAAHYILYVGAVLLAVGWRTGLAFMIIHETLFSAYLGLAFITNHIGMAVLAPGSGIGFLRVQVGTSRNLTANRITDYVFGALSCQIEHHLFPAMPRHRLRTAAPLVRAFCRDRAIAYHETSVMGALHEVRAQLRTSAAPLNQRRAPMASRVPPATDSRPA